LTKRYDEPIEVTPDPAEPAAPVAFSWRGRRYDIDQRLKSWREAGGWWDHAQVREHEYHRVLARPSGMLCTGDLDADGFLQAVTGVYDLYRDRRGGGWRLARVWD